MVGGARWVGGWSATMIHRCPALALLVSDEDATTASITVGPSILTASHTDPAVITISCVLVELTYTLVVCQVPQLKCKAVSQI